MSEKVGMVGIVCAAVDACDLECGICGWWGCRLPMRGWGGAGWQRWQPSSITRDNTSSSYLGFYDSSSSDYIARTRTAHQYSTQENEKQVNHIVWKMFYSMHKHDEHRHRQRKWIYSHFAPSSGGSECGAAAPFFGVSDFSGVCINIITTAINSLTDFMWICEM